MSVKYKSINDKARSGFEELDKDEKEIMVDMDNAINKSELIFKNFLFLINQDQTNSEFVFHNKLIMRCVRICAFYRYKRVQRYKKSSEKSVFFRRIVLQCDM